MTTTQLQNPGDEFGKQPLPRLDAETELARDIGKVRFPWHGCTLERKTVNTSAGQTCYTVMHVDPNALVRVIGDPRFSQFGIKADGILINQQKTSEAWQTASKDKTPFRVQNPAQVGRTLEEFLDSCHDVPNAVAHYMNHYGWQYGEAIIAEGEIYTIPGDPLLPRYSSVLCKTESGWNFEKIVLNSNNRADYANIEIGFSLPLIVQSGLPEPIQFLLNEPRLSADPRNGINFTPGAEKGEFFPPFREGPLMLIRPFEYRALLNGLTIEVSGHTNLTPEGYETIQRTMTDKTREFIAIELKGDVTTLKVLRPLPKQSIPAFILGHAEDNKLVTITVDGRQPGRSVGATFEELQMIAINEGMYNAGLGPAGNDVATLVKTSGKFMYASSPCTGTSRPLPAALVIACKGMLYKS